LRDLYAGEPLDPVYGFVLNRKPPGFVAEPLNALGFGQDQREQAACSSAGLLTQGVPPRTLRRRMRARAIRPRKSDVGATKGNT
jgi:hypothetical protein